MVLLYRSGSAALYHLLNWQTTDSVWFITHCFWLVTVFLHETKIRYAFSMCFFYRLIFLPTTVLGLASTDWITCCHLPQEKKKHMTAGLPPLCLHIQFRNTALDRRIWSNTNTLCFLWLVYYRWQTYSSLYSSLWPGDHGYSSTTTQKEIKHSHFENCSTNAFPQDICHCSCSSFLSWHTFSIPHISFCSLSASPKPFLFHLLFKRIINVESHNWLSFKGRNNALDPTDSQEETLLFSGATCVICKPSQKE